jgi:predicted RNA polymerase sigma factor
MLLIDARRAARTRADGTLVPLEDQDRRLWNREMISEGVQLISATLARSMVGPYQIQAAIAAVHAEAGGADRTDWRQIAALYELLEQLAPNVMVSLNRAVAAGMAYGPDNGFDVLRTVQDDPRLAKHHRFHAVRAHLFEMAGDEPSALESYEIAARLTTSLPEQRYLNTRAERLRLRRTEQTPS